MLLIFGRQRLFDDVVEKLNLPRIVVELKSVADINWAIAGVVCRPVMTARQ
jgi:hypothetical protein